MRTELKRRVALHNISEEAISFVTVVHFERSYFFRQENLARSGKRQRKRSVSTGSVEEAIQNHHPSEQSETNAHTKKRKRHEKHQAENGQSVQGILKSTVFPPALFCL